ncbi:MAG: D-2-hydroxyacid dehydrogenase [Rhodospirillales bacterium]|nr:D-2-hydroxyacid dehydrogenase [Rhodospirillales bacterium]
MNLGHHREVLVINPDEDDAFAVTPAQWHAALRRAGQPPFTARVLAEAEARDALATAEIVITGPAILARLLALPMPRLRAAFLLAAGVDRLAGQPWPAGVRLLNNRGVHGAKLHDYILWALLALHLRAPALGAAQAARRWQPIFTRAIAGGRLTVVGTGDLGGAAAGAGRTLGMRVTGISRQGRAHPACERVLPSAALDAALAETDALVLACPLTPATRGLLDARRLGLLPAGAHVVNVGRGALLDQAALVAALAAGRLGGAVLDVTDPEPPPPEDPLWSAPNLILTPHVAADDPAIYNDASLDLFFATIDQPAPPNLVDLSLGY